MSEEKEKGAAAPMPPGVCIPWAEQLEKMGEIKGDAGIIKSEWEHLDMFAYLYLWYWVHR